MKNDASTTIMSLEINKTCSLPNVSNSFNNGATADTTGGVSGGVPIFWGGHTGTSNLGHTGCRRLNVGKGLWENSCPYLFSHGRTKHVVYPMNDDDLWLMGKEIISQWNKFKIKTQKLILDTPAGSKSLTW